MLNSFTSYISQNFRLLPLEIEVHVFSRGFPKFEIVGLPSKNINESAKRIKSAIVNSGFKFPASRVLVSLNPHDIPKTDALYDIPIALGLLAKTCKLYLNDNYVFLGTLNLDGSISSSYLEGLTSEFSNSHKVIFVPASSMSIVRSVYKGGLVPYHSLVELVNILSKPDISAHVNYSEITTTFSQHKRANTSYSIDSSPGQLFAKRALMISFAGRHPTLVLSSDSKSSRSLVGHYFDLLPPLCVKEVAENIKMQSHLCKKLPCSDKVYLRPLEVISKDSRKLKVKKTNNGGSYNALTESCGTLVVEDINRLSSTELGDLFFLLNDCHAVNSYQQRELSASGCKTHLIAVTGSCTCLGSSNVNHKCTCLPARVNKDSTSLQKLSSEFGIHITIPITDSLNQLTAQNLGQHIYGKTICTQLSKAYERQYKRYDMNFYNSNAPVNLFVKHAKISDLLLNKFYTWCYSLGINSGLNLSFCRLARTIADLEDAACVEEEHLLEALQYRFKL